MTRFLVAAAVLVLATAAGRADDSVENPEYKDWAVLKVGTTLKTKTVTEGKDVKAKTVVTTIKLVEVGKDKVVLVIGGTATRDGKEVAREMGRMYDVQKMIMVPDGSKPLSGKPDGTTAEGKETLKVGGVEVKTRWYKYKTKTPDREAEGQVWLADDVPRRTVKSVETVAGVKTTMEVTELKKP